MIDRDFYYGAVRKTLFHELSQSQVDGMNHLLDVWDEHYSEHPLHYLAYCLATTFHETARTMHPIEEWGRGHGRPYGPTGYWGRGYVQLTWEANYKRASERLGQIDVKVDLVTNKALAMDPIIAAHVMYLGMLQGWFTGRKLEDYIPGDPINARRIINGLDKARDIAKYHAYFDAALRLAPEPDGQDVVDDTPAGGPST